MTLFHLKPFPIALRIKNKFLNLAYIPPYGLALHYLSLFPVLPCILFSNTFEKFQVFEILAPVCVHVISSTYYTPFPHSSSLGKLLLVLSSLLWEPSLHLLLISGWVNCLFSELPWHQDLLVNIGVIMFYRNLLFTCLSLLVDCECHTVKNHVNFNSITSLAYNRGPGM